MHLRADDGIRTRDPHLGKVMRYQLRYVRAQRTRSSPGAKHDDSPRDPAHTNPLVPCVSRLTLAQVTACGAFLRTAVRASLRRRSPSRRRSRGSVEERPLHTRKVAGSIPAGTTENLPLSEAIIRRNMQLGHTAYGPTVAGHGKDVPKNVTHAESTRSIVEFILDRDLTDFILVGHGYAGTIISKAVEVIPERVRRLVFWSAYVLNDGETALEMLPDSAEALTQMAADSADNTFMIPFDMWRDVFINDGDPDLVQRSYAQLSSEPFGPWTEPLKMEKFHSLQIPRSFLVGAADLVMPPGDSG